MILSIGVDVLKVYCMNEVNIVLVFVSLIEVGEWDFFFYCKFFVDMLFELSFVNDIDVNENDVVYFCFVDLVDSLMRDVYY